MFPGSSLTSRASCETARRRRLHSERFGRAAARLWAPGCSSRNASSSRSLFFSLRSFSGLHRNKFRAAPLTHAAGRARRVVLRLRPIPVSATPLWFVSLFQFCPQGTPLTVAFLLEHSENRRCGIDLVRYRKLTRHAAPGLGQPIEFRPSYFAGQGKHSAATPRRAEHNNTPRSSGLAGATRLQVPAVHQEAAVLRAPPAPVACRELSTLPRRRDGNRMERAGASRLTRCRKVSGSS